MTFIRAFQGLDGFRGDAAFSTWITRIALNVSHSHHQWRSAQKRQMDPEAAAFAAPSAACDPEHRVHQAECRRRVLQMIRSLPKRYRRAMALRYVSDCSYAEIESALAVPIGTVKTWLWRGRQILRDREDAGEVGRERRQHGRAAGRIAPERSHAGGRRRLRA